MAYSYVRYTGNGSTTNYTFSFPTISTDHLKVRVNGTLVTNWSFLNASTVQFAAAPASGAIIEIRRETPKESAIVNFTDGSVLLERDLDLLATYDLYLAQETKDGLDSAITQTSLGVFDAQSRRITNVATPTDSADAVTKAYADVLLNQTQASASAAASSASSANTSAVNAASSASSALSSKNSSEAIQSNITSLFNQLSDGVRNSFVPGVNFTVGVTSSLTLTNLPAKQEAFFVFFDGVCLDKTDYTLVGSTLNFTLPIPNVQVEVVYFTPSQLVGLSASDLTKLGEALLASSSASMAKTAAEAARDAAQLSSGVYATTAAGIAATVSGRYFSVPSALVDEYLILYLNNAGVANQVKIYPSANALVELKSTPVPNAVYAVQDNFSNAAMIVESDGDFLFSSIDSDKVNGISRYSLNQAVRSSPNISASIVHHISYGQSLSLGNGDGIQTLASVDGGFFDSVMFNANGSTTAGPRAQEGSGTVAQNHASLIPYVERPVSGGAPSGNFETPLGNSLRMVKRLLRDENNVLTTDFDYILLGSAPGQSNTTIAGLIKGQTPYTNLTNDVTYGLALAQAAGKSYAVDVVYWSQGEADITAGTARATYSAALLQLYADLNTDIKTITGQSNNIKLVMYQCSVYNQSNPNIALAQLDAAKANSNIIISTAVYALEHFSATNVHLAPIGYAMLGAYYGLTTKRTVVDGETWGMLYPTRITRQGAILDVEFPDTKYGIALSNALFPTVANSGFTAVNASSVDNPIVSVSVVSPKRLKVVLTNAVSGKLRYGFSSWGGNLHNLCDIDPSAARSLPMYQPGLIFEESFL